MHSALIRSTLAPLLLVGLSLGTPGCCLFDSGTSTSTEGTAETVVDCPVGLQPPADLTPDSDAPEGSFVTMMSSTYSTGGIMINVDVVEPFAPSSGGGPEGTVRVWAGAGSLPSALPPASEVRLRSPASYDLSAYRWAASTTVRLDGDIEVWAIVEVDLDGSTAPLQRALTWDLADTTIHSIWRDAADYP